MDVGTDVFDQTSAANFISAVDWNNDGFQDLLFNGNRLLMNNGPPHWNFTHQSTVFNSTTSGSTNGVWADWDGDGDQDLYQGCGQGTADRFWENQGAPDFRLIDVSTEVFNSWKNIHPNTGNAWGDFDRDGDLDLYVGNGEDWNDGNPIYFPDHFLRNEKGQTFTDISSTVGIRTDENFYSRGVTWGDYNNDHWQDAYVSHYRIRENHLFENRMDGTFNEVGQEKNCSGTYANDWYYDATAGNVYGQYWWGPNWGHTIGSAWADLNRDGNLDLWTSDFVHKYVGYIGSTYDIRGYVCDDGNLYINDGAPYYRFTDYRNTSGIPRWPVGGQGTYRGDQTFSGVAIGDYDNDGWEDIYIPQVYGDLSYTTPHLYHNKGHSTDPSIPDGTTFEDVTDKLGIKGSNTYACLWVDYDNDGDLDLVTGGGDRWDGSNWQGYRLRLYQNQLSSGDHWLEIKLKQDGLDPDAVGARVTVRYKLDDENVMITREVRAGTGHAHQEAVTLHFGLGPSIGARPMIIDIVWPDGLIQETSSYADTIIEIERQDGEGPDIQGYTVSSPLKEDSNVTITIDAVSTDSYISLYQWDLDSDNLFDVNTDWTEPRISIPVHHDGIFHVRCRVRDGSNLGRDLYPIVVEVKNIPPAIDIVDRMVEMDAIVVLKDIVADTPSDLVNISWEIDWGDAASNKGSGHISTSHSYSAPGRYTIRIDVIDGTDEVSKSAFVDVLNVDPWGWVEPGDGNDTVHFEDDLIYFAPVVFDSPSDTGQKKMKWDFGDGTEQETWSDLSEGIHRYTGTGNYTVKASVRDQYGGGGTLLGWVNITNRAPALNWVDDDPGLLLIDEDSALDLDDIVEGLDTQSDLHSLEYNWDFGNGNESGWRSTPDIGYVYQFSGVYDVTCTVRDDDGSSASLSLKVEVRNVAPQIEEISPLFDVYEDEIVELRVKGKDTSSDRENLVYELRFPNDNNIRSSNGTFTFSLPQEGRYDLIVAVVDDDLESDEEELYLNVLNMLPRGGILTENSSYDEDEVITFEAVDLWDTPHDLEFLLVTWDFDDDSGPVTGPKALHTYSRKGRYTVKMTIDDGDDRVEIKKDMVIGNPVPRAVIEVTSNSVDVGSVITFSANGSSDNPSDMVSLLFLWDFDDGDDAEGTVVIHAFSKAGSYRVILEVMDDDGAVSYAEVTIEVKGTDQIVAPDGNGGSDILLTVLLVIIAFLLIGGVVVVGVVLVRKKRYPPESSGIPMPVFPPQQLPAGYQRNIPPTLPPSQGPVTDRPPPPPLPPSPPRAP
ncbi:MAG: PKD domain-containing protein [Candidatus Thermoplasmatota archaeon]|nr:PKD domain-containing protein [Candidatus Thermoplasmatota archaeon]